MVAIGISLSNLENLDNNILKNSNYILVAKYTI